MNPIWDFRPGTLLNKPEEYTRFSVVAKVPFPLGGHVLVVRCKNLADGWNNEGTAPILGPSAGDALGKAQNAFGYGHKNDLAILPDNEALDSARKYFNLKVKPEDRIIPEIESIDGSIDGDLFAQRLQERKWIVAKSGAYLFHDTWDHATALFYLPAKIWQTMFGIIQAKQYDPKLPEQEKKEESQVARIARKIDIVTANLTKVLGMRSASSQDLSEGAESLLEMVATVSPLTENDLYQAVAERVQILEKVMPCKEAEAWAEAVLAWSSHIISEKGRIL